MHIRRLYLTGHVCNRNPDRKITNYYSWPLGHNYRDVEKIIASFKKAFCKSSVVLHWM